MIGASEHEQTRRVLLEGLCRETISRVGDDLSISLQQVVSTNTENVRALFQPLLDGRITPDLVPVSLMELFLATERITLDV